MRRDAFVAATPPLPSLRYLSNLSRPLLHRPRGSRPITTLAALRVGARNGDSRAPDRGVHRRPLIDSRPLLATMPGLHPDAPRTASKRRYKTEVAAIRARAEKDKAALKGWMRYGGDVCDGPAASFLMRLRSMWLARAEDISQGRKVEPLTGAHRRLVGRLVKEIRACDEAYYGDVPKKRIPDEEYDELVMHLAELERVYPALVTPDSPTQVVGHAASFARVRGEEREDRILTPVTLATVMAQRFPPHRHVTRMLSLANAYTPDDVSAFLARAAKLEADLREAEGEVVEGGEGSVRPGRPAFCVEAKVDGVALALSYRGGRLVAAATRGDGVVGDDVTENVRAALVGRGVPEEVPGELNVEIRGEVYIRPDEFDALCDDDLARLANPRNAAAGGLKNKDPQEAAKRLMRFVGYECLRVADELVEGAAGEGREGAGQAGPLVVNHWPTQVETLEGLADWGVGAMPVYQLCHTEDEINYFATAKEAERKSLPFEADGVVIKVNDSRARQALGSTAKSPRGSVALKFHSLGAETVVESVVMQVSRAGIVTPVALLRPVSIGRVTVSRATLHNFDEIERLGVAVGDTVLVLRGGDVIPKVKAVKKRSEEGARKAIEIPSTCPSCQGPVQVTKNEATATVVTCTNTELCSAQGLGRLLHFCRRDGMDVQGVGAKTAKKLLDSGLVVSLSDLFELTMSQLRRLDGYGETNARNLHSAIRVAAVERSLERLIVALGIPGVGRASARALALHAGSIEGLIQFADAGMEHLMQLPNVAEKSAEAMYVYLCEPRVQAELAAFARLLTLDRVVEDDGPADPFVSTISSFSLAEDGEGVTTVAGMSFAFTGKMKEMVRPEAMKQIRALGGKTVSSVSRKTDFVVVGSDPGLKHQKALRCGCKILAEEDLAKLLESAEASKAAAGSNVPLEGDKVDCWETVR